MLIARILPIMSIYRLPHGQYGYSGHVLNLPQDVTSFINSLPRSPADLDIIVVRKEGATDTHKDFRVRRSVVLQALQWLVDNNVYYRDVTIDHSVLALLPVDGQLTQIKTVRVSSSEVDMPAREDEHPHSAHLPSTFIPMPQRGITEEEAIEQSVIQGNNHVNWPSITGNAVNEFTTEGYMSCAFPILFPTGMADFLAPRHRPVTIGNFFKHLMLFHDQRFARHPRFRYVYMHSY